MAETVRLNGAPRDVTTTDRRADEEEEAPGSRFMGVLTFLGTVVMLPFVVFFIAVWLAGWHLGMVQTGSMEPALPTGSLVVLSPVTADEVQAGMVIEFVDPDRPERIVTHRVIEVERDAGGEISFVTKGDANSDRDTAAVPAENVRAKVRWHVRGIGAVLWSLRWPYSLGFVLVPVALTMVTSARRRRRTKTRPDSPVPSREGPLAGPCRSCRAPLQAAHRYCWHCGIRQPASGRDQVRSAESPRPRP